MQTTDSHSREGNTSGLMPTAEHGLSRHESTYAGGPLAGMPRRGYEHFITEWATQHAESRL